MKVWRAKNKHKTQEYEKIQRAKTRKIVLEHYGGIPPKCACCGEGQMEFLCIDHINNDGSNHRKRIGITSGHLASWIIKNKFPELFQILCHNCNNAKGFYGKCPHKNGSDSEVVYRRPARNPKTREYPQKR